MKALYHTEGNEPKEFTVLKKNKDGTVDIGPAGGDAVVTNCQLVSEPRPGYATAVDESKPVESEKAK